MLVVQGGLVARLQAVAPNPSNTVVRIQVDRGTNHLGTVDVELFDQDKPETVRNFLLYVRSGAFSNSFLHRAVPGFVVQGGGFTVTNPLSSQAFTNFVEVPTYGRLTNEFSIGPRLTNLYGTIAMAKVGSDPDSATSQWFFNLANNSTNLDNQNGGFTVFGRVLDSTNSTDGTNVLNQFNALSSGAGIVNLGSLIGTAYQVFNQLPVSYTNTTSRVPAYNELYFTTASVLGETNSPDAIPPSITITSPAPNMRFTNQPVFVRGSATDDQGVARVLYRVQGGAEQTASGSNSWVLGLNPTPGFNTVSVQALDWSGNRSTNPASVTFFYVAQMPLNLQITGRGKVTGVSTGQLVQAGSSYTATAKPGSAQVFDSWSGTVTSSNATFTFQVPTNATNFSLTAKFIPDPFVRLAGDYRGLWLRDTNRPALDTSGLFTLSLSRGGSFSGNIAHRGGRYVFTGRFDRTGNAFIQGTLGGTSRSFSLHLDTTNQLGLITANALGSNTFEIMLERTLSRLPASNAPPAGVYTFVITNSLQPAPGQPDPGGQGFGSGTVSHNGHLKLKGTLGDGTRFGAAASLTEFRRWPIYLSLAGGRGLVQGWLAATNLPDLIQGTVQWVRMPDVKAASYPGGFSNQLQFAGSPYAPPTAGQHVLRWFNGMAQLQGANLAVGTTNFLRLTPTNTFAIAVPNPNLLTLHLDLKTGFVDGQFVHPWAGTTNHLRGVVFGAGQSVLGQFPDGNQVGSIAVGSTPFLVTQTVAQVTLDAFKTALREGGLLRFTNDGVLVLTNECPIDLDTLLDANGHSIVIRGAGATRLFHVRTNIAFGAIGITFADGFQAGRAGTNGVVAEPGAEACGAGILNPGGNLSLTNCTFTNFVARGGPGGISTSTSTNNTNNLVAPGGRALGAALCNRGGNVALDGCVFVDNLAEAGSGQADVLSGRISSARGSALGGAIFSDGPSVIATNTSFFGNQAIGGAARSLTNGTATTSGHGFGGAIALTSGSLRLLSSTLMTNLAAGAAAPTNSPGAGSAFGGAIFVETNAQAEIRTTLLATNAALAGDVTGTAPAADGQGGGIYTAGTVLLSDSTFESNLARGSSGDASGDGLGGAVATLGTLTMNSSTLARNVALGGDPNGPTGTNTTGGAASGGGIYSTRGTLNLTNSTLALNQALSGSENGGVLTNGNTAGLRQGGAIYMLSNTVSIAHLTIALNTAGSAPATGTNAASALGGGLAGQGVSISMRACILSSNAPANFLGGVVDGGQNISSDASFALVSAGSRVSVDPLLGPLDANGGPTLTMVPFPTSPARDIVPTNSLPALDQRGITRPQGGSGDAGSVEVVLTVPFIVLQPFGGGPRAGTNWTFQVSAGGAPPLAYAWYQDGVALTSATNSTLFLLNVQSTNSGSYTVVITNSFGAITSAVAVLTVDSTPRITAQPADQQVGPGGTATFLVSATPAPLSFSWYHDGVLIDGATNSILSVVNAGPADKGGYQAVATNLFGAATSQVAVLSFDQTALRIVTQPVSITALEGTTNGFTVVVSGVQPIFYQWYAGATILAGETNFSLTFAPVDRTNSGTYRVVVTNAYLSLTSLSASLTVTIPSGPAPRSLLLFTSRTGPNLFITCRGEPGRTIQLQRAGSATAAGAAWESVGTQQLPAAGEFTWTRALSTNQAEFFRVITP